jgi:hypothetical protein
MDVQILQRLIMIQPQLQMIIRVHIRWLDVQILRRLIMIQPQLQMMVRVHIERVPTLLETIPIQRLIAPAPSTTLTPRLDLLRVQTDALLLNVVL